MSQHSTSASPLADPSVAPAADLDAHSIVRQLAHDLCQPLSTIESIAYYLDIVVPRQDDRVRQQVDKLRQVAQHASWILSDAVHFVQASPSAPQTLDLNELTIDALREAMGGGHPWLQTDLCDCSPLVRIDVEQGRHMLRNALLLFGQLPCARVALTTERAGDEVVLSISATGVELTHDELAPLLGSLSSEIPTGFGLGLASIRRIVETHSGRVKLTVAPESQLSLRVVFPSAA